MMKPMKEKKRGWNNSINNGGFSSRNVRSKVDNDHQSKEKRREVLPEALELSSKLKSFSINKQVEEALALYNSTPFHIRDGHHLSILVDCCARCGSIERAEQLIQQFQNEKKGHKISVQCQTALLKGYAHSGNMKKATKLFHSMISENQKSRNKTKDAPNVRTLNTLLRGCMWTATTTTIDENQNNDPLLVGGVVSCQKALQSIHQSKKDKVIVELDESSYEYSIVILCQALQCQEAQQLLQQCAGKIPDESLAVVYVALSRAYALLGNVSKAQEFAHNGLQSIQQAYSSSQKQTNNNHTNEKLNHTNGGKRSWKQRGKMDHSESSFTNNNNYNNNGNRREESNLIFRKHRLTELQTEAQTIQTICKNDPDRIKSYGSKNDGIMAKMLLSRLLYFSGGGTTPTDTINHHNQQQQQNLREQLLIPLWFSFGLAASINRPIIKENQTFSKKDRKALYTFLNNQNPLEHNIDKNGRIQFESIFDSTNNTGTGMKKEGPQIHLELGAGSGDWIVTQAQCNPKDWYVSVELRADRVAQTFAKCLLAGGGDETTKIVENVCVIGAEAGSLLRQHIQPQSISTIFINHPEPPTQTFASDLDSIMKKNNEPAHMLQSSTLLEIGKCLRPNGQGRLVIVTDNRWYARLICLSLQKAMLLYSPPDNERHEYLFHNHNPSHHHFGGGKKLFHVETFHYHQNDKKKKQISDVIMYEGKPSEQIGHYVPSTAASSSNSSSSVGSSYFDRLWMSGAGKHAEMKKRFIIVMESYDPNTASLKATTTTNYNIKKGKKNKKRSQARQEKRNQMRLERKRQAAMWQKESKQES